jgi:hypothetical protein
MRYLGKGGGPLLIVSHCPVTEKAVKISDSELPFRLKDLNFPWPVPVEVLRLAGLNLFLACNLAIPLEAPVRVFCFLPPPPSVQSIPLPAPPNCASTRSFACVENMIVQ